MLELFAALWAAQAAEENIDFTVYSFVEVLRGLAPPVLKLSDPGEPTFVLAGLLRLGGSR